LVPPPELTGTNGQVALGERLYGENCALCHGAAARGGVKDLRHMTADTHRQFNDIVLRGIYLDKGMASFADLLDQEQADAIHAYLIARANEDWGRSD
jgi:quinohemoprotein ethanol dehydrogenase